MESPNHWCVSPGLGSEPKFYNYSISRNTNVAETNSKLRASLS